MSKFPLIAPSILSADFSQLDREVQSIEQSGAHWVHLDVMDGAFVPPITFGHKLVADIKGHTSLPLDVHLMVQDPMGQADGFLEAGADYLTFHIEAEIHAHRLLSYIKDRECRCGISLVPSTPVELLQPLLPLVDLILVMTVNPGYGGQKMIPQCLEKVSRLREWREQGRGDYWISIDGGVNVDTLPEIAQVQPDVLVAGSAFFQAPDKKSLVKTLCSRWGG